MGPCVSALALGYYAWYIWMDSSAVVWIYAGSFGSVVGYASDDAAVSAVLIGAIW